MVLSKHKTEKDFNMKALLITTVSVLLLNIVTVVLVSVINHTSQNTEIGLYMVLGMTDLMSLTFFAIILDGLPDEEDGAMPEDGEPCS